MPLKSEILVLTNDVWSSNGLVIFFLMLKKNDCNFNNFNKQLTHNNKIIILNKYNYTFRWSKKEAGRYVFI